MSHYVLHNPISRAHLEELEDRLSQFLADMRPRRHDAAGSDVLIRTVTDVVRAMDAGQLSLEEVRAALSPSHFSGFCFDRWMDEMVEEGVYLELGLANAA